MVVGRWKLTRSSRLRVGSGPRVLSFLPIPFDVHPRPAREHPFEPARGPGREIGQAAGVPLELARGRDLPKSCVVGVRHINDPGAIHRHGEGMVEGGGGPGRVGGKMGRVAGLLIPYQVP